MLRKTYYNTAVVPTIQQKIRAEITSINMFVYTYYTLNLIGACQAHVYVSKMRQ
jgi:hypothetical protein